MPDYHHTTVYLVGCLETDDVYINGTTLLNVRVAMMNMKFRKFKFERLENILYSRTLFFRKLEVLPNSSLEQMNERINHYIKKYPNAINKNIKYNSVKPVRKNYWEINKKKYTNYNNNYREQKRGLRVKCECGTEISWLSLYSHVRSKKHSRLKKQLPKNIRTPIAR